MVVTNNEKLSKLLFAFVNALEFFMVFGKHYTREREKVEYVTITLFFGKLKL